MTNHDAYDEGYDAYWNGLDHEIIHMTRKKSPRNATPGKRVGGRLENTTTMRARDDDYAAESLRKNSYAAFLHCIRRRSKGTQRPVTDENSHAIEAAYCSLPESTREMLVCLAPFTGVGFVGHARLACGMPYDCGRSLFGHRCRGT